jgi:hypothetical protein
MGFDFEEGFTEMDKDCNMANGICGRTNLNYTGSSTRDHFSGLRRASNGITLWPVG